MSKGHYNHSGVAVAVTVQPGGLDQLFNLRLCQIGPGMPARVGAGLGRYKFTRVGSPTHGFN